MGDLSEYGGRGTEAASFAASFASSRADPTPMLAWVYQSVHKVDR